MSSFTGGGGTAGNSGNAAADKPHAAISSSHQSCNSAPCVPLSTSLLGFGKHKNQTYSDVIAHHPDYCQWVLSNCGPDKSQALRNFADFLRANVQVAAPPKSPVKSVAMAPQTPSTVLKRASSSSAPAKPHAAISSHQPAPDLLLSSINFAILDTETTGLSKRDRVVEVAVQRISSDGRQLAQIFSSMVNPGPAVNMHSAAAKVTGISNDMIHADGVPSFSRVYPMLMEQLEGCVIVAHNAAFDEKMIMQSCDGHLVPPIQPWLCSLRLSQRLLPLPGHKLSDLCDYFGISLNCAHRASGDVEALAKVLPRLLELCERLHGIRTWGELQRFIQRPAVSGARPSSSRPASAQSAHPPFPPPDDASPCAHACGGGSNHAAAAAPACVPPIMNPPTPYDASAPCGEHEWDSRTRKWNGNLCVIVASLHNSLCRSFRCFLIAVAFAKSFLPFFQARS